MPQTLGRFDTPIRDGQGRLYEARVCGREDDTHRWEAWIEFENTETGDVIRSARETTQPNLTDLRYWAGGLSEVYLEGALDRSLHTTPPRKPRPTPGPVFDGPAGHHDAVLDPFSVYDKSPDLLAQELTALRGWHLRQIIRDYKLVREGDASVDLLTEAQLGSLILQRVKELRG